MYFKRFLITWMNPGIQILTLLMQFWWTTIMCVCFLLMYTVSINYWSGLEWFSSAINTSMSMLSCSSTGDEAAIIVCSCSITVLAEVAAVALHDFFLHYFHGSSFLGGCNRKTSLGNCRCWEQLWVEHGVERVHITFFMPGVALYVYPLSAIYKRLWEKEFHHQHCPRCLLNSKCTILDSSACLCCLSITLAQNLQEFLN